MTLDWPNRVFGISDDQQNDETRAQRRLTAAIEEMRAAIKDVNSTSVVVEIEPSSFDDFVHDQYPSASYWAEKLREARRGV